MAIKIKIPKSGDKRGKTIPGLPRDPVVRAALIVFLVLAIALVAFSYFYIKYDRIIAQRFRSPVFSNSAKIYALPRTVHDGEKTTPKKSPRNCAGPDIPIRRASRRSGQLSPDQRRN